MAQEKKSTWKCFHYSAMKTLDTYLFFAAALASLVKELLQSCATDEQKKIEFEYLWLYVKERWKDENIEKQNFIFDLLCRKQIFPYSYLTDVDVLKEEKLPDLPDWNKGYILKEPFTQQECDLAHKTFKDLNCDSIGSYLDGKWCRWKFYDKRY